MDYVNSKNYLSLVVQYLATLAFYFMGTGIFYYLGGIVNWLIFLIGLMIVFLFQISSTQLDTFFDLNLSRTQVLPGKEDGVESQRNKVILRVRRALLVAISTLTTGSFLTYFLSIQHKLSSASLLIFASFILFVLLYSVPPINMASRGLGELVQAVFIGYLVPAFGFLLQNGEMHRLVPMITMPFLSLLMAALISSNLPTSQFPNAKKPLTLAQISLWNIKIEIHNWLIILTYLFIALAFFADLPWGLTWPLLAGFPLSVLSIREMFRIKGGAKPRRNLLLLGGLGSAGCTIYLITFVLWIA